MTSKVDPVEFPFKHRLVWKHTHMAGAVYLITSGSDKDPSCSVPHSSPFLLLAVWTTGKPYPQSKVIAQCSQEVDIWEHSRLRCTASGRNRLGYLDDYGATWCVASASCFEGRNNCTTKKKRMYYNITIWNLLFLYLRLWQIGQGCVVVKWNKGLSVDIRMKFWQCLFVVAYHCSSELKRDILSSQHCVTAQHEHTHMHAST